RVKGTSNRRILLPLYNVQEALRQPFRRGREISGSRPQVHEEAAQVLPFERLGQARLLLRLRLTGGVLLRGGSRRLDQRRIPRPSGGLADDEARIVGTINTCVYRHEHPMVRDQR